jgi:S1-C subfamily serine protease
MEKIVITDSDLKKVEEEPVQQATLPVVDCPPIAWWAKTLVILLIPLLPLLCLAALFIRLGKRESPLRESAAWAQFLCSTLIVSGLLHAIALLALAYHFKDDVKFNEEGERQQSAETSGTVPRNDAESNLRTMPFALDSLNSFPELPREDYLPEHAEEAMNSMVFLVTSQPDGFPWMKSNWRAMGTAVLLWSSPENGYLFGTAAHVVEGAQKVRVACNQQREQTSSAHVAGLNLEADLALLWMEPSGKESDFLQPILPYQDIAIGSRVYSIGHPEGHLFTLSDGLVSQKRKPNVLQTSAPVSPGNSGGPLYDEAGNLLAIITHVEDKAREPNAENLNFGYRAEIFLNSSEGWNFSGRGAEIHEKFRRAHLAE